MLQRKICFPALSLFEYFKSEVRFSGYPVRNLDYG